MENCMQNRRIKYEEVKAYASNGLSKFTQQELRGTFQFAYGLIEEIQKAYGNGNGNGNGLGKLNGVFESELESLRKLEKDIMVDQAKKLSLIAILDESPVVRRVAVVLLLGLATKIANSQKTPSREEVQLANDIFNFVISYMKDEYNTRRIRENTSLLSFVINKRDAYYSVISTLALFDYPVEDRASPDSWKSMVALLQNLPGFHVP